MAKGAGCWCSAINCTNNSSKSEGVSFFRFPKEEEKSREWVIATRREDLLNKDSKYLYNNCRICSKHFESHMFLNDLKNRLHAHAVPTLFAIPNPPPTISSKRKLPYPRTASPVVKRPCITTGQISPVGNPTVLEQQNLGDRIALAVSPAFVESFEQSPCTSRQSLLEYSEGIQTPASLKHDTPRKVILRKKVRSFGMARRHLLSQCEDKKSTTTSTLDDFQRLAEKFLPHSVASFVKIEAELKQKKENGSRDHQRKRCHKINSRQTAVLINYMCGHRNFALGKFDCSGGKVASERQWEILQNKLNEHGPPKSVEQWKKAWKDIRGRTRAKMARLDAERAITGNISHITASLSEMEEKVISLIGTKTSVPLIESEGEQSTTVRDTNETEDCDFLDGVEVYIESAAPEEAESEQASSHLRDNGEPQRERPKGLMGELSDLKDEDSVDERSVTALESIASSLKIIADGQKKIVALLMKAVEKRV